MLLAMAGARHVQARAQAVSAAVLYHDQSGTVRNDMTPQQAAQLASAQLGFTVRLPATWPRGAPLRALWVMNQRKPRFVVLYYGDSGGYITCQLHESLNVTSPLMNWAPQSPVTVGRSQGTLLRAWIGGANPVVELIWRLHGVRYDLLGSTSTPLALLMKIATSVQ